MENRKKFLEYRCICTNFVPKCHLPLVRRWRSVGSIDLETPHPLTWEMGFAAPTPLPGFEIVVGISKRVQPHALPTLKAFNRAAYKGE